MYKDKPLNLNNIFSFWHHFREGELFLFYNPIEDELIIGAGKLKSFEPAEKISGYKYVFSTKTFFEQVKEGIWNGYGSENMAFSHYLTVKNGKQTLFYATEDEPEIEDIALENEHYQYELVNQGIDDYQNWQTLFNACHDRIKSKALSKVVISRVATIQLSKKANDECIIKRLLENNKSHFIFAYRKEGKCFLGATPEVLLEKKGSRIESHALAGTLIKNGADEQDAQALLQDEKNAQEHKLVISNIQNVFNAFGENTDVYPTQVMETTNLYHLHTKLVTESEETIFRWRDRLHPTPALGGTPRNIALDLIEKNEGHERGLYAAPLGVVDENGNGVFVVGIRSGLLCDDKLYGFAGCGIVEASDCEAEFIETQAKLKTLLDCL